MTNISGAYYYLGITGEPGRCLATTSDGSPVFYYMTLNDSLWVENQIILCVRLEPGIERCDGCDGFATVRIIGYVIKPNTWAIARIHRPPLFCDRCIMCAPSMDMGELDYYLKGEE
jgi:hypothetical protein